MNKKKRKQIIAYLLAFAMILSCFTQNMMASASQTESTSEQSEDTSSRTDLIKSSLPDTISELKENKYRLTNEGVNTQKYEISVSGVKDGGCFKFAGLDIGNYQPLTYDNIDSTTTEIEDKSCGDVSGNPTGICHGFRSLGYIDSSEESIDKAGKDAEFTVNKIIFKDKITFTLNKKLSYAGTTQLANVDNTEEGNIIAYSDDMKYVLAKYGGLLRLFGLSKPFDSVSLSKTYDIEKKDVRKIVYYTTVKDTKINSDGTTNLKFIDAASVEHTVKQSTNDSGYEIETNLETENGNGTKPLENFGYINDDESIVNAAGENSKLEIYCMIIDGYIFDLTDILDFSVKDRSNGMANIWNTNEGDIVYYSNDKKAMLVNDGSRKSFELYVLSEKKQSESTTAPSEKPTETTNPSNETTDFENGATDAHCKLTGIYFANKNDYPNADVQVRTTAKNKFSIGGKTAWDFGWIAIEPDDGMKIESIIDSKGTNVEKMTWGEAKQNINSMGVELSEKASAAMEGKADDTIVIYMDRNIYNKYVFGNNIKINLEDTNGDTSCTEIQVENSHHWINVEVSLGDKIKPLELDSVKKLYNGRNLSTSEFEIENYGVNGSANDCLIKNSDEEGEYIANKVGLAGVKYTDKTSGISFEVNVSIRLPENSIAKDDIILDDAAIAETYSANVGSYVIKPKDEDTLALKNCTIQITLPEGVVIDWTNTKYAGNILVQNGTASMNLNPENETYSRKIEIKHSTSGRVNTFEFSSDCALQDTLDLVADQNGKSVNYTFYFSRNSYMSMSGQQTYYVMPNQIVSAFDFVSINGDTKEIIEKRKQKLIDEVNSGKVTIEIPGSDLYYEDGKFNGKVVFTHPGSYMTLYNKEYKLIIQSGDMDVRCMTSGIVKEGDAINLAKTFFNGYWEDGSYSVDFGENVYEGFKYDDATHTVTAPNGISNKIVQNVYIKKLGKIVAQIRLNVCRKENYENDFADAVSGIKENENMIVDAKEKDAVLSKEVIEALQESGNNKKLTIKNSSSENDVEWNFDSSKLTEKRTDDIKLKVEVGKEDTEIKNLFDKNKTSGLEVKFENNGKLGGTVSVRIYLNGDNKKKLAAANSLYLYYYNKETGKFAREAASLELHNDKIKNMDYIEIPVTHNSDFVLSADASLDGMVVKPTETVTASPTKEPSGNKTAKPSQSPTKEPSGNETAKPSQSPTVEPSGNETAKPSQSPTTEPSGNETAKPSQSPTTKPTVKPQKKVTVPAMKSVKVSAKNKKITVRWKKLSKITGYQLQISDKKNFKKAKTIKYKAKINKVTLSKANGKKLKKKKKYYIRVRAYKTYKDSKGKTKIAYGKYKVLNIKCK